MSRAQAQPPHPTGRLIRMPDAIATTGLSQATINRLVRRGEFPPKVRLSAGAIGWWESEVEAWKASRQRCHSSGPSAPGGGRRPAPG
ncbi:helix-turn-helix transcriptional regulator [Sphingomonas canadensis]|uniref:Helix-turn-helix transcriptional regulator n=1 Tax=Sphingomonas canadensis TaxID=1219257 RepID=A0ABW3HER6_9SPHN|nr:AlpA family phage regulatory protein [Sphingomonas canadensis]MCW3837857.1 AlpA family phage regulatory protein [Sphingomonas canadensis]